MIPVTLAGMSHDEDEKAQLRARYPDWQIWYVPNPHGGPTWCARPRPNLTAGSAAELAQVIEAAERASDGFDPESDTPERVKGS